MSSKWEGEGEVHFLQRRDETKDTRKGPPVPAHPPLSLQQPHVVVVWF